MKLHITGDINPYYVQTLCMVFFPGAKFSESEVVTPQTPVLDLRMVPRADGAVSAYVTLTVGDKQAEAVETVPAREDLTVAKQVKIAAGRAVFSAGKGMFRYTPPWGILTGVRPAKIAAAFLQQGLGINKTKKMLQEEYFLNPQKAALSVAVANTELHATKRTTDRPCSLYISIPFCPTRCAYCSFVSYTTPRLLSLIDVYLETLKADIVNLCTLIKQLELQVVTVYIGGGTPTILNPAQLDELLSCVSAQLDVSTLEEYTLEAGRPDTITDEKLRIARAHGVTRVSVNPQTLNDEILRSIGRRHTAAQFFDAYQSAVNAGFRNINVDLIAGLPGDNFSNFSKTLDTVIDLAPSNITVHTFCVKKAAELLRGQANVYSRSGGDAAKCVSYSQLKTKFAGYKPYYMYRQKNTVGNLENVGYAKEGAEGMYNIYMMEELHTIFAAGAGAVTKLVAREGDESLITRIFTPKYPYEYLRDAALLREGDPTRGKKSLTEQVFDFYQKNRLV
ncbi:MAG: coproporphyrinogen dehydrogenase HemZ [Eubacteriales bacterium]